MAQTPILCDLCQSGKNVNFYCINCEETLCERCKLAHINSKRTKNDKVVLLSEANLEGQVKSPTILCDRHPSEEVTLFCEKCEQFICILCMEESHKAHSLTTMKTAKELTSLQHSEDTRYTESCSNIKAQDSTLRVAFQSLDTSLASGNPVSMTEASEDINGTIQGLRDPCTPQIRNPKFREENITRETILQKMLRKDQKVEPTDVKSHTNINQQNIVYVKKDKSDSVNLKKLSKIKVEGKNESIAVIIALRDNTFWVADNKDKHLCLIDCKGNVLKKSHTESLEIYDAKEYKNKLLVTYFRGKIINMMSTDGQSKSMFADLSPFYTRGLCVTSELDVLVCLRSSTEESDNKVVRLGSSGKIKQTIQYNKGSPLYSNPQSVTSLPTGEVVVADSSGGVIGVSRSGDPMFTWKGEVDGIRDEIFKASYVTHDNSSNLYVANFASDKVYVLQKQSKGARCIMDKSQEIISPLGITVDNTGNLLVGCLFGEIHIIAK